VWESTDRRLMVQAGLDSVSKIANPKRAGGVAQNITKVPIKLN
jgi:hypothetical protein